MQVKLFFVTFNLNYRLHIISVGKPSDRMSGGSTLQDGMQQGFICLATVGQLYFRYAQKYIPVQALTSELDAALTISYIVKD